MSDVSGVRRGILIGVGISAAAVLLLGALWFMAAHLLRTDLVLMQELSPDRLVMATVVERDMGATTDYSTLVTLHHVEGTARDGDEVVFSLEGRASMEVVWLGKTTLGVYCPGVVEHSGENPMHDRSVFRAETQWHDICIRYLTDSEYKASRPRPAFP